MPPRFKWPLYLLAAYPIVDYFLHIYPWGIVGAGWDILVLLFLAIFAGRAYMVGVRKELWPTHRMVIYMAVLGLAYVVMDIGYLNVAFAGWRVDFLYMLFTLVLPYAVSKEDVVPLIKFTILAAFLMAIHGVYQYIFKAPIPVAWTVALQHVRTRVYSLFGSPNILGSYMAFISPLALGVALYETRRSARLFYGAAAVVCAITLVFTYTRGAWLAFFIGMMLFTWLWDKRLTFVLIALAVVSYFVVPPIHARIYEFLSPVYWTQTFASGRIARWEHAYDQMRYNPLFGAGLGRYGGAVAAHYFGIIYVDNEYAKTLAEIGLVGLLSFFALLFVYLRDVWRVWKRATDPRMKFILTGIFCSLVVLVVHNSIENIFEVPSMNFLFWFVGSLALIYGAEVKATHD